MQILVIADIFGHDCIYTLSVYSFILFGVLFKILLFKNLFYFIYLLQIFIFSYRLIYFYFSCINFCTIILYTIIIFYNILK